MCPQVSVLIPVYNRAHMIADCLDSAIRQAGNFGDFEIVVVDNFSDDGTWQICQQYALIHSCLRIFRNDKNIGPVLNWRRCSEEARGKYCKILFSDDLLEDGCLVQMVQQIKNSEVAFVYSAAKIGVDDKNFLIHYLEKKSGFINSKTYIDYVINGRAPISPGSVLIRTQDFRENLLIDIPTAVRRNFRLHGSGPDVLILLLTAEKYKYVYCVANPLVFFRIHFGSLTVENKSNQVVDGFTSAVSYYLKTRNLHLKRIRFVSRFWMKSIKDHKKWIDPLKFSTDHEGVGSFSELGMILFFSVWNSLLFLWRRLGCR